MDAMVRKVTEIDSDFEVYQTMLSCNPFIDNKCHSKNDKQIRDFLIRIASEVNISFLLCV